MKRLLVVTLLVLSSFGCGMHPKPTAHTGTSRTVQRALDSTVVLRDLTGRAFCSGVVSNAIVWTAHHCVEGGRPFMVEYQGENKSPTDLHVWPSQDLAALKLIGVDLPRGVPFARKAPNYGDTIITLGHHGGDDYPYTMTRGIVSNPRRVDGLTPDMVWMQHDAPILGGASGGPVFNDRGELVGITSFGALTPIRCLFGCPGVYQNTDVNGAVHFETLVRALRELSK